jgi:hypothetical protein
MGYITLAMSLKLKPWERDEIVSTGTLLTMNGDTAQSTTHLSLIDAQIFCETASKY